MADKTGIEWTDATWNPVRGCSRVSPGCGGPNHQGGCYAEKIAARFSDPGQPFHGFAERTKHGGRWTGKLALIEDMLYLPLRWKKPRMIFVNSMSDLFHAALSDKDIDRVFAVMALCPQHTFQVLTKRADRMRAYACDPRTPGRIARAVLDMLIAGSVDVAKVGDAWPVQSIGDVDFPDDVTMNVWPLPNVWLGSSVEDQSRADERREHMHSIAEQGWTTWVSYEPALGSVDWSGWEFLRWLVSGGESGPKARPSHPDWHRAARDFCAAHDIAYLFKQWGSCLPGDMDGEDERGRPAYQIDEEHSSIDYDDLGRGRVVYAHGYSFIQFSHKKTGRMLDGVLHDGYPEARP